MAYVAFAEKQFVLATHYVFFYFEKMANKYNSIAEITAEKDC